MPPAAQSDTWTTRRLLTWTTEYFQRQGLDHARLCAEMLLAHVLGVERLRLYMEVDRPASEAERTAFRSLVARAVANEPVDYLVGQAPFFSMWLKVTPATLIPRPSSETIVEHVIAQERSVGPREDGPLIADIGTGSGAIAIALAKHIPGARVIATDISEAAMKIARENAAAQGVAERITFRVGDLYEPLAGERVDYLVSNPPYISDAEWADVPTNVKEHEPTSALRGGADGLAYLRPLIAGAAAHVEPGGQVALEIAASQEQAVLELAGAAGVREARVLKDHEGLPRVLVAAC
ncbi:MAG: peptide chain release factor N(5)-glutamine methyltransferase [Phycisphaeraceae bacterium]